MPRRAQNPHHPLTRLRRQLSTSDHAVTREELAQKTKIPLGSIKAIESGRYALTSQIASKISLGVPVNPLDLLKGREPLRDFAGKPVSPDSVMWEKLADPFLSQRAGFETDQYVERVALGVAEKKFKAMQLRFLMREAFAEILESLELSQLLAEELTEHLSEHPGEFDPAQVMYQMRPHEGPPAKRWEAFEGLVLREQNRLWAERQDQDPIFRETPGMSKEEKRLLSLESDKFNHDLWAEALENVAKAQPRRD